MSAELCVPPSAVSDKNACELIRAWAAHGGLHCSLNVEAWPDDKAASGWGILLSDVARHVADALKQSQGFEQPDTINQIRAVFNSELTAPTAHTKGGFT
jgi:hypothetical protein